MGKYIPLMNEYDLYKMNNVGNTECGCHLFITELQEGVMLMMRYDILDFVSISLVGQADVKVFCTSLDVRMQRHTFVPTRSLL